jgi:F0F1-type ATP synthase epsilon subunit
MKCAVVSTTGRDDFDNVSSIHVVTTTGELQILTGHVAVVSALKGGPSLTLRAGGEIIRFELAPGSFIRFDSDTAEVLSAKYSFEREAASGDA